MKKIVLFLCGIGPLVAFAGAATNYQPLKKVSVPGTGGWDYVTVDAIARRVHCLCERV
jgi:hypothetical protein